MVNYLEVDLSVSGRDVRPLFARGSCQKLNQLSRRSLPIAGINGGYADGLCRSVSLVKTGGNLLVTNARSRGSFAIIDGSPVISRIAAGMGWPSAQNALGGGPILAMESQPTNSEQWHREGLSNPAFLGPNPRTRVGYARKKVYLGTVDGRRPTALGFSMSQLAQYVTDLGLESALNLDGGGSTTLWIRGKPNDGIINYPSGGGTNENSSRPGIRPVRSGIFVFP
ncbi:MAG: phosphodiester glycosidase family protein [Pseudobacteriovorax sp.]|nr:phosphodiester glycosidase family protein [Pseudobacteriovorax sp.]